MASRYQRPDSSFWWIKFRDEHGTVRREATKFRVGVGAETRACERHVALLTLQEKNRGQVVREGYAFGNWVPEFLQLTHANSPKTLTKYESCWRAVWRWLTIAGLVSPIHIQRDHATKYLAWRTSQKIPGLIGKKLVCRNSALLDLVIFRLVMYEAVKRGYIATNPIAKLRLKPDRAREKPEFSPIQIQELREALKRKPDWMRVSFEIALYQGFRFSETCFPLSDVNLQDGTVTIRIKGGKRHATRLHGGLRPMIEQMIAEGRAMTFEMPTRNATRDWSRLFKRLKMPGYSFHCTRVTCITMLARSGRVNEQQAMAYIGHAHSEIHRIYQRLKPRDLSACEDAISFDKPSLF